MENEDSFFEKVYKIVIQIPVGKVTTYGAIASCIGSKQSARMVGWALNKCSFYHTYVPAHRVVNRNGLLTGKRHFDNFETMKELLRSENIIIENDQIIDFENYFWNPYKELF